MSVAVEDFSGALEALDSLRAIPSAVPTLVRRPPRLSARNPTRQSHRPRAESVRIAFALRQEGLKLRQIAERMGVAISTVNSWLCDPDGARLAARKDSYRGCCEECGAPTDGSNGIGKAPRVCIDCLTWTEEKVIAALHRWAARHGGEPPREADWRRASSEHPSSTAAARHGGWNNLLLKAGFRLWCDRRPETQERIESLLREGVPLDAVAERMGTTPGNIRMRLRTRGLTVEDVRNGLSSHTYATEEAV